MFSQVDQSYDVKETDIGVDLCQPVPVSVCGSELLSHEYRSGASSAMWCPSTLLYLPVQTQVGDDGTVGYCVVCDCSMP